MQANRGVTGQILDVSTNTPVEASMRIVGRDMPFRNFPKTGEFWRILLPGKYVLEVGFKTYYCFFVVKNKSVVVLAKAVVVQKLFVTWLCDFIVFLCLISWSHFEFGIIFIFYRVQSF